MSAMSRLVTKQLGIEVCKAADLQLPSRGMLDEGSERGGGKGCTRSKNGE